jgi:hypothetical protein
MHERALSVYEPGGIMKSILLASALWLLVAILVAVFVGKFIKGVRRRHRPRSDGPFSASAGTYEGSGVDGDNGRMG